MSFLFFGIRPLYIVLESDTLLFDDLFKIGISLQELNLSMWWATFGLIAFCVGSKLVGVRKNRFASSKQKSQKPASSRVAGYLLFYQILSLPIMLALANTGRSLYSSSLGAYAYDLPVPLQSGHIIAIVVIFDRFLQKQTSSRLTLVFLSGTLFLYFTWLMREVSMFRGFYIAGIMIAGIAVLSRLKKRVSLGWLILPVLVFQPLFRSLGEQRYMSNDQIANQTFSELAFGEGSVFESYWNFYDSNGDMNIFDTFAAARQADVSKRPFLLSWLYVPAHLVPRAIWKSKPKQGILQDVSFMNGAPYCPGIAGFFLLDGGEVWMLGSMFVLGCLVSLLDEWCLSLSHTHLRSCAIGLLSVNAMFLTRFFLWQYFYQVLYAIVPCIAWAWWFRQRRSQRKQLSPMDRPGQIASTDESTSLEIDQ
ncbi:hypothetical protein Pan14r_51010 [Crateriforma conspicua]|uniref:Uncharacterized protein n=2 Tax=Crateriforma conspicua TaxID=2527996 RepID=A0A5C5XRM9_9PLAN|nr:hypothetical protein Pan14r_51010 [Crateriforma conspicua]